MVFSIAASPLSANSPTIWKPSAGLPQIKIVVGMLALRSEWRLAAADANENYCFE